MTTSTVEPDNGTETTLANGTITTEFPSSTTTSEPTTVPSTPSSTPIPWSPSMNDGQIAGVVIGVILFIVFATLLAFFIVWRRRRLNMNKPPPPELPSAYDVGTRYKHRESDSNPTYVDPEPRHYINCEDGTQEGINNPAFDGDDDDDEQDENYEIPVQNQENRPPRPSQAAQQAQDDDDMDSEDYVNPQPKQEVDEDYEIPETNKRQQPAQQEEEEDEEGNHSEGDYFDMSQGRQSGTAEDNAEASPPPPPCKPGKHSGYVNEQVASDVHSGPSYYQNMSMPNLSGAASLSGRPLRSTGASIHGSGSNPRGRGRGGPSRKPHFVSSKPQGAAREAPPVVDDKSEDEDVNSYENVPAKKQRSPKR